MRLTDLKGVIDNLPRTVEGARKAIYRYEQNNKDLDPNTRRLMALGAVSKYFGRRVLEELNGKKLPNLPFRDWSWRWWNVLYLSNLGYLWPDFANIASRKGNLRAAARWLRKQVTPEEYLLFLRRAGTNPHNNGRAIKPKKRKKVWTKAGTWDLRSPMTRLLVHKEHLPGRPLVKDWQHKLGDKGVWLIENELMCLYDPDIVPANELKAHAIEYVRRRIAHMLGRRRTMGYAAAAWFFQEPVLDLTKGSLLVLTDGGRVVLRKLQGMRAFMQRMEW